MALSPCFHSVVVRKIPETTISQTQMGCQVTISSYCESHNLQELLCTLWSWTSNHCPPFVETHNSIFPCFISLCSPLAPQQIQFILSMEWSTIPFCIAFVQLLHLETASFSLNLLSLPPYSRNCLTVYLWYCRCHGGEHTWRDGGIVVHRHFIILLWLTNAFRLGILLHASVFFSGPGRA